MILNKEYQNISVMLHDPVALGALIPITLDHFAVDQRLKLLECSVSKAAASHYSQSHSISLFVPGLRTATGLNKTMIRCIHGQLPTGISMNIGRETIWSADVPPSGPGSDTDVFALFPPADFRDRKFIDHNDPFYIDHDAVTGQIGVIKFQVTKVGASAVPVYDWKKDQGNAGLIIFQIDIPYTEGEISGRAAEAALETTGSGPTIIFLREAGGDPNDPYEWHMIGCLAKEIEAAYNREVAQSFKGYNQVITSASLTKNLTDFNCNSLGDTLYLETILNSGKIEDRGYAKVVTPKYGGALQEFEAILQTRSTRGMLKFVRNSRCYVDRNGNTNYGAAEKQIPFKIVGEEPGSPWFWNNLFQTEFIVIGVTVV